MALVVVAGMLAPPAAASGFVYPYRSGVSADRFTADHGDCLDLSGVPRVAPAAGAPGYNPSLSTGQAAAAGAISGFMIGLMQARARRQMTEVNYAKCMAIKGYQRRIMPSDAARDLRRLSDADRAAAVAARAGDPQTTDPIED